MFTNFRTWDAPCPASSGDRGHSGQCKKAPGNVMHKRSGGTYSKPDARVKLIPTEDIITYARHGKTFGRTVGSADLQKRRCRRSVTPPPGSRRVSIARSTLPTQKATAPLSQKSTAPYTHKVATQLTPKPMSPPPPPPPVASCLSAKRFEKAGNRKIVSLKKPSPLCKSVQRAAVPPAVLRKESEMNPISPSSVHVLPEHSIKVPLATKAEPSKSVSTKSNIRNERQINPEASISCNISSGTPAISHTKLYKKPDQSKSTTQAPHVEPSNYFEALQSTQIHTRNEIQTNQEAPISCDMSSGAPPISHTKLYKKPDQLKSVTQAPRVEPSNDFEALPSTQIHTSDEIQTNQEASISCNMSSGAQAILHTELYNKPYQPESITPGPCVELSNNLDAFPSYKSHMSNDRQTNQEVSTSCGMPSGAPLILHTEPRKKTHQADACWKGKFEVTGELTHTCDEIEAHFPLEIFINVYQASKQMPEVLKLEALPLSYLLPKKFKMEPPDAQDIGLCFISSHQRPNRNFDHLLEKLSSHIGLRTDIGTIELLIFSSKLLTEDDQTKDGKLFFCGVFRKHPRKKSGIKVKLTGDEEANGINKCMPMLKTPDANATSHAAPAVSFFTGSCSPVSAGSPCKAAMRAPASGDLILDSPPGDVPPPGFTSVRTGETASSRLVLDSLDDVPPGFTPAHRGLHTSTLFSEKKSAIKFSLNVTRPVKTEDIPPGFSKPIGNANQKEIKHDKVAVEVDDGSEERRIPKTKRLSDILGFSPASSSNNARTSSSQRNCSEVCTSAAAVVPRASKFQETAGPPEVQKLCRKRGQPEPSDPSPAEATKRLKVNGRIALTRSMDRPAL
uniref:Uncharacterized protein n=1 Tax=Avena sativa TaxID=4498 RepID=A0ACD5X0Z1_AVESA